MNITVSTRIDAISDETKDYAFQKAQKLDKYSSLRKIEIIMDMQKGRYNVEILASPEKGNVIVGEAEGEEWLSAIDFAIDKVERQLRKIKGKSKSHRMKKFTPESQKKEEPDIPQEEQTYDDIVDEMRSK